MADAPTSHVTHEFPVMGTTAQLLLRSDEHSARPLLQDAERELHRLSALLTRFDPGSELERLNDARTAEVGGELLELLDAALERFHATDGRFDVGIGAQLVAAGYDRTYRLLDQLDDSARSELAGSMRPDTNEVAAHGGAPPCTIVGRTVTVRDGARIDLGGIAKGWAADRVVRQLAAASDCSALVSLGGDIAVSVVDGDRPWPVGIDAGADGSVTLALAFGGLATSAWRGRAWRRADGELAHHVIDPRTGQSATTDIARITVIAPTCLDAEVWATSLMLVGSDAAEHEANDRGLAALIVRADDACVRTAELANAR